MYYQYNTKENNKSTMCYVANMSCDLSPPLHVLSSDNLRGDDCVGGWLVGPDLQLAIHLAPDACVTPQ